ncbi:VOC family protein [Reinekea forsetii]|nr:VOC family protein [Reinekea forsetii]
MSLGCFSISLAVKDLSASKAFYEKLGFSSFGGDESHGYLIMKNGQTNIGLFQGMFENNILTFNPGWDQDAQPVGNFEDVRELHAKFKADALNVSEGSLEGDNGPGNFSITDPDGNQILIDQHV